MKRILYFLTIALSFIAVSCNDDDVIYKTAPRAAFTASETSEGYEIGSPISFTDASTPEANTHIVSWLWDFGDEAKTTSTEQNPSFTYTKEGVYTVSLTVTDNNNLTARSSQSITVLDPTAAISVQWASNINGSVTGGSSPAVSADGKTVYMLTGGNATAPGRLTAYNISTGGTSWELNIDAAMVSYHNGGSSAAGCKDIYSSPSVGANGHVYFIARDLKDAGANRRLFVFAATPKGNVAWAYAGADANLYSITPAIDAEGNVYTAQRKGKIWKISNGTCTEYASGLSDITGGLSASRTGHLYGAGKGNAGYFGFDTAIGANLWRYNSEFGGASSAFTGALRSSTPAIAADGTLYAVADKATGGMVMALNADGTLKWKYDTKTAIADGGIVIAKDGTVYANLGVATETNPSGVVALNSDGSVKWTYSVDASVQTTPMIDNRGYIHFIDANATYYILKTDGTLFSSLSLGESSASTPVMDSKGNTFVVVTKDGALQMLCVTTRAASYATDAAWPMRGQNPQRTGLQK